MKQTAVLWVMDQLATLNALKELDGIDGLEYFHRLKQIQQKGLTMEKEQIIDAHGNKQKTKSNPGSIVTFGYTYTGEMYYNEKFKGIKPII